MPPLRNNAPKPSARKTLNTLSKPELVELAELLEVDINPAMTKAQIRNVVDPAVEQAVASGTTHVDFARILPPRKQTPEEDKDEEDEEEDDTEFHGIGSVCYARS
jgi:hypothetical protein